MAQILSESTSSDDFATRVGSLAAMLSAGTTVLDDGARDKLDGGKEGDWFFADIDGLDGDDDKVKKLKAEDLLQPL